MSSSDAAIDSLGGDDNGISRWSPQQRESFFDAIARHRRAAWQVRMVTRVCVTILAVIVALLMSPLYYAIIGLLLDAINLIIPMPDLIGAIFAGLDPITDAPGEVPLWRWLYIGFLAALPGLLAMLLVLKFLSRVVREAEASDLSQLAARSPRASMLAEQRFGNVIEEMALAANVRPPQVLIVEHNAANAAVFGADETHATVAISSGLLQQLDRSQMQGVAGHLIGLIANGDVPQGMRMAQTLSLFGFVARLSDAVVDPPAWKRLARQLRAAFRADASQADTELLLDLTNPFGNSPAGGSSSNTSNKLTWREWVRMPLFGPVVFSGFFGGLVSTVLLEPLIALVWRRRKYMADAIATQLTRYPDALASALSKLGGVETGGAFPAWTSHMSLLQGARRGGLLGGSALPLFPPLDRRLRALGQMGAEVRTLRRTMPSWTWLAIVPLGILIGGLLCVAIYLLVLVSVALSGLFTWTPTVLLHLLLR